MSSPQKQREQLEIVFVGHMVKEVIYFQDRRSIGPVLGGPVAYGSLMATRLGSNVGIVSILGSDMPDAVLDTVSASGMNLDGLHIRPGNFTTTTELVYDNQGNKEVRYLQKAPSISLRDIPQHYLNAKILSVVTMDHDVPLDVVHQICSLPSLRAVDLGGYGGAHSRKHPSRAERRQSSIISELVACFDVVHASVEDCALLFGPSCVTSRAVQGEIVRLFLRWGVKVVLLTLADQGSLVGTSQRIRHIPAEPGHVIDTTGAGDTFLAAFLVHFIEACDAERAAEFATAAVTHVIERTGGAHSQRMPSREDVWARLNTTDSVDHSPRPRAQRRIIRGP